MTYNQYKQTNIANIAAIRDGIVIAATLKVFMRRGAVCYYPTIWHKLLMSPTVLLCIDTKKGEATP